MSTTEWIRQRRNIRGQTVYVFWRRRDYPDAGLTGDMYIASQPRVTA